MSYFVAGTGTEVGKTLVSAALVSQLGAPWRVRKPLASGVDPTDENSDPAILARAQQGAEEEICLHRFQAKLAPDRAAIAENVVLDWSAIVTFCQGEHLITEGAGGLFSPMTETRTNADLASVLGLPILLVAGTYLGTLSHILATLLAARARGLTIDGLVLSQSLQSDAPRILAERLRALCDAPPIFCLPRIDGMEPWRAVPDMRQWLGEIRRRG